MIEDRYKISHGQLNDLAGTKLTKQQFSILSAEEVGGKLKKGEKAPSLISFGFAKKRYPILEVKLIEIKKSIERGEMTKRILADKDCILKKKPVGWAKLTGMFFEDLTDLIAELTKKHEYLKRSRYIIFKNKKLEYYEGGGMNAVNQS